jgi:hypothetical protein
MHVATDMNIALYKSPKDVLERINFLIAVVKRCDVAEYRKREIMNEIDYLITTLEGYED